MKLTLALFLNFSNFEPQYSYRLYSYKKVSGICLYCYQGLNTLFKKILNLNKLSEKIYFGQAEIANNKEAK